MADFVLVGMLGVAAFVAVIAVWPPSHSPRVDSRPVSRDRRVAEAGPRPKRDPAVDYIWWMLRL